MRLDLLQRLLPALTDADVKTLVDEPHVGAEDATEHNVADAIISDVFVRNPRFLDESAFHAELCSDRRHLARMVRLHTADRHQRVGVGGDGVRNNVFELPELVAAEGQPRIAVLALGVELDLAPEMRGEAREPFDMRRAEGEGIASKFREHRAATPSLDKQRSTRSPQPRSACERAHSVGIGALL